MRLQKNNLQSKLELADLMFKNEQYLDAAKYYMDIKIYKSVKECFEFAISKSETNKEHEARIAYAEVLVKLQLYEKAKE